MTVIQPYLDRYTKLDLMSGKLGGELDLTLLADGGFAANGTVQVDRFRTVDKALQEDFIKWQRLRAEGFSYDGRTAELSIKTLRMRSPYARVIIAEDETINVVEIMTPAKPAPAYQTTVQMATAEGPPPQETQVRIDNVAIEDGSLNFADFWIQPNYARQHPAAERQHRRALLRRGLAREARPRGQGGPLRARDHRRRDEPALGDALHRTSA